MGFDLDGCSCNYLSILFFKYLTTQEITRNNFRNFILETKTNQINDSAHKSYRLMLHLIILVKLFSNVKYRKNYA